MNKIISYITAGEPSGEITREVIENLAMESDFVMVGLPFSDPVADGPVVEKSFMSALEAGVTTDCVFSMIKGVSENKVVLTTYANPVFAYGYNRFFSQCKACGVFGVLIHDIPYEEYGEIKEYADKYEIHLITAIMPTSSERLELLCSSASGFIYLVAAMNENGDIDTFSINMLDKISKLTNVPVYIGGFFKTKEQESKVRNIGSGVVLGDALVKIIVEHGEKSIPILKNYLQKVSE